MKKLVVFLILFLPVCGFSQTWNDLNNLGIAAYKNGDYELAISHYEKALKLVTKEYGKLHNNYATCLNNLGMVYKVAFDFEKAEIYFKEALELREKTIGKNTKDYSISLNNLASVYKGMAKYEDAETYYLEALSVAESLFGKLSPNYAIYINNLAGLYKIMGKYKEAESYYLESAQILKSNYGAQHPEYGTCLNNLAVLYDRMGNYTKAEQLWIEVLKIIKENKGAETYDYGIALNNAAIFYEDMGDYNKAETYFIQSIDIIKKSMGSNNPGYANCINNLALFYTNLGNVKQAEALMLQALQIRKDVLGELHPEYALSLNTLGQFYDDYLKNFEIAETYLLKSMEIRKKIFGEYGADYAVSLNSLAVHYKNQGDFEKAEPLFLQCLELNKKAFGKNHPTYAISLNNLADLYNLTNRNQEALKLYLEALEIKKNIFGEESEEYTNIIENLAIVYGDLGEYEKSEEMLLKGLQLNERIFGKLHPSYLLELADVIAGYMKVESYEKAVPYFDLATEGFHNAVLQNSSFLSELEMENYLHTEVSQLNGFQSFEWIVNQRFKNITATMFNLRLFMDGIQLRTSTNLKSNLLNSADTTLIFKYQKWINLRYQISKQYTLPISERNADLGVWQNETNALEKELVRNSSEFANESAFRSIQWTDLKEQLNDEEAGVEFISFQYHNGKQWTDSILYAAVIFSSKDSVPHYVPLFEEAQLKGLLNGDSLRTFANLLYTQAQVRTTEHDISYGDSLYQLVWRPLEPYLAGIHHILYAPAGLLHNLSFDAIPANESKLLSDQYQLTRLTTLVKLMEKKTSHFEPTSMSIFGGIQYDMDSTALAQFANETTATNYSFYSFNNGYAGIEGSGGSWNYLPGSVAETNLISDIFKNHHILCNTYAEQYANEESVKNLNSKNSPSILHFSTHGFFFPDPEMSLGSLDPDQDEINPAFQPVANPLFRSGLILSGANYVWTGNHPLPNVEDGILTAYEVSNLYLPNTELVVLSACETGLGDIKGTEGVYGLQRAFKMAGVNYMIMSLWQVLDKETSEFMILFYEKLLEKKSIPDAFKITQDIMKNKYRDEPYKWAGFVLIR